MIRRPPRSTRTDTLFPTRRSSDLFMPDTAPAVQFTVLGPDGPPLDGADSRLADFYAYPEGLTSCWVRGNMIASVDGGATVDRSEEHTSELQSLMRITYAGVCLKNKTTPE